VWESDQYRLITSIKILKLIGDFGFEGIYETVEEKGYGDSLCEVEGHCHGIVTVLWDDANKHQSGGQECVCDEVSGVHVDVFRGVDDFDVPDLVEYA